MKKLFYFAAMLLCIAACSNDDDQTTNLESFNIGIETNWENQLDKYRDFDPATAPDLFAGKTWRICYEAKCDSNFNFQELWFSYLTSPIKPIPPGGHLFDYDMELCTEDDPERTWTYNPETKTIVIQNFISGTGEYIDHCYQLYALAEDLMACNYCYMDFNTRQMIYRQRIYMTVETWDSLIENVTD